MARRRSFLAEIQHQAKIAERDRVRALREADRNHARALKEQERARKAGERAARQYERATEAERKRWEKEEKKAYVEARLAEAEGLNLELAEYDQELSSLLASTLEVDDYVDLETLRTTPAHPPFDRPELQYRINRPPPAPMPSEPQFDPPAAPTGLFAFFSKGKHAAAVAAAEAEHEDALSHWRSETERLTAEHNEALAKHAVRESARVENLRLAREQYDLECAEREAEAITQNQQLDSLIANLGYGVPEAVEEYLGIVLSNSCYPESFTVAHEFSFEPSEAELRLKALVPGPSSISPTKAFKYTKSKDEISETQLSQKAQKDRYASAIHQVALRTLHEVFEADRRGIVRTISLEVGTSTVAPATGLETYIPFVSVAAERESFMQFDLSAVQPDATLQHLGASLSKNPFGFIACVTTGVRQG